MARRTLDESGTMAREAKAKTGHGMGALSLLKLVRSKNGVDTISKKDDESGGDDS